MKAVRAGLAFLIVFLDHVLQVVGWIAECTCEVRLDEAEIVHSHGLICASAGGQENQRQGMGTGSEYALVWETDQPRARSGSG